MIRVGALAVAVYAGAALVVAAPALDRFESAYVTDRSEARPGFGEAASGDHHQTVYRFWLVGHRLARGEAPWRDPYSFQPEAAEQVVLGGWPFGLAFWPLEALAGPVVAWNVLLMTTVVLAGVAACAWLRSLALGTAAALVGGLVFAVSPYRIAQSGGHLVGWIAILVPAALWAFERARAAAAPRSQHLFGVLAALALVSVPVSGQLQLALALVPFALAYAAVRFHRVASAWMAGGALVAAAVAVAIERLVIADSVARGGRSLREVGFYSADWIDLVSRSRQRGIEQFVFVGWLTPLLAGAGIVALARRQRTLAVLLGAAAVLPLLLALGTNLPGYELLRTLFPPLRYPRVPSRFVTIAVLAIAALAAVAAARLLGRLPRRQLAPASVILLALVAADLLVFPLRSSAADPDNGAYRRLRDAPPGRLLELPVVTGTLGHHASAYDYYAMQAIRERPSGYSSVAPRRARGVLRRLGHLNCGELGPAERRLLRRLGVRYVAFHLGVFHRAGLEGAWFAWRALQRSGYRTLERDGPVRLLARVPGPVEPEPVPAPSGRDPVFCDGWHRDLTTVPVARLLVFGGGTAVLTLVPPVSPLNSWLTVDGGRVRAFRLDGRTTISLPLGTKQRWHRITLRTPLTGTFLADLRVQRRRR